jgi:hypothetical protein
MMDNDDWLPLTSQRLPPAFARWRVALPAGVELRTSAAEWAGSIVVVEQGTIEIGCVGGGRATFVAGDVLALGCLALQSLFNPGPESVRLVAIRRRGYDRHDD